MAVSSGPIQSEEPEKHEQAGAITLHLDDVDVRKALELLSRESSLNILVSPGVTGRVTANIQSLLPEEALAAILKLANLAALRERDLIYVYTHQEMTELKDRDRKLSTRVFHLNYLRGNDLEKMIMPFLSPDVGKVAVTPASAVGIASHTESAGGDSLAGSDTVIIQDYESVLQNVDQIIARLDVQPAQVVIEAVILEVLLRNSKDLGVNFGVLDGAGRALTLIGNGAEINAAAGFKPNEVLVAGAATTPGTRGNVKGTSLTGFAANEHGVKFGFADRDVTGFIRALEQQGETRVLASPRILVLNKQRAELIIGDRLGYKTQTVTETASIEKVEFLNVGTQLRLRPFVASDGTIRMEIHPERSSGEVDRETGLPRSSTSEVTTNVIVPDGSTIVIAGLLQDEDQMQRSGVPGLSRLRWVGAAFRQKSNSKTKKELVVLLTPRIWKTGQQDSGRGSLLPGLAGQNSEFPSIHGQVGQNLQGQEPSTLILKAQE